MTPFFCWALIVWLLVVDADATFISLASPRIFPLVIFQPLTTYVGIIVDEFLATHYELLTRWAHFASPMQIPFAQLCLSTIKH